MNKSLSFDTVYQRFFSFSGTSVNIFGILGNLWVLGTFAKYKQLRKKECLYLIAGLAYMDLSTAIGSSFYNMTQMAVSFGVITHFNKGFCLAAAYGQMFGYKGGQCMLIFIAFDRFTAFWDHLAYRNKQHKRYAVRSFAFSFAYAALASFSMFLGVDFAARPKYCAIGASMTPAFGLFWSLFVLTVSFVILFLYRSSLVLMRKVQAGAANHDAAMERQFKITRTITIVLFFYVLFWVLPNLVLIFWIFFKNSPVMQARIGAVVTLGTALNCAANPFVYAAKHGALRGYMFAAIKGGQVASSTVKKIKPGTL